MIKCTCEDWGPNIKIINDITMHAYMAWGNKNGWDGKIFEFCPWCGSELKDDVEDSRQKIKVNPIKKCMCI